MLAEILKYREMYSTEKSNPNLKANQLLPNIMAFPQ